MLLVNRYAKQPCDGLSENLWERIHLEDLLTYLHTDLQSNNSDIACISPQKRMLVTNGQRHHLGLNLLQNNYPHCRYAGCRFAGKPKSLCKSQMAKHGDVNWLTRWNASGFVDPETWQEQLHKKLSSDVSSADIHKICSSQAAENKTKIYYILYQVTSLRFWVRECLHK